MMHIRRLPLVVVLLTLLAIGAVTLLSGVADTSRQGEVRASASLLALTDLQGAPFGADPHAGGSPVAVGAEIASDESTLRSDLSDSLGGKQSRLAGLPEFERVESLVSQIYRIAVSPHGLTGTPQTNVLQGRIMVATTRLSSLLRGVSRVDAARATRTRWAAAIGTAVAMLALAAVFLVFYVRSLRARAAAEELAGESEVQARTDALTGLGNRRALTAALGVATSAETSGSEWLLAMFDLNGFKQYNDTFGHGAGDELLMRLGANLANCVDGRGSAYRMGGDEFCVLARRGVEEAESFFVQAASALSEAGDGWSIDCSYGGAWIPTEAATPSEALRTVDQRMYANKASRSSTSRQLTDVLLQVLAEHDEHLDAHVGRVADMAARVAEGMGRPSHEVQHISQAAKLHDVGKTAIPDMILSKPGALTESEWAFVHNHTLVGERVALAAPALASAAPLIRSSHERHDGAGYPDGLAGGAIPLGSRIIAVCDAFDAMTSARPYRQVVSVEEALAELKRCSGSQFDPAVVDVFCDLVITLSLTEHDAQADLATREARKGPPC